MKTKVTMIGILLILIFSSNNYSQGFWQHLSGLDTGWVRSIAIDSSNNIYAGLNKYDGIAQSLVFKSTDDGDSWNEMINFSGDSIFTWIWSLFVSPSNKIYAAVNGGNGLYRSTNAGQNWESFDLGIPNNNVNDVTVDIDENIYAATDYGLYIGRDGGSTWKLSDNGIPETSIYTIEYDFINDIIYTGTYNVGMFKSYDSGETWIEINEGLNNVFMYGLGINFNGDVFAGADWGGLYKSTNQGDNWIQLTNGIAYPNFSIPAIAFNSLGHIFIGREVGVQCYRSVDGGNSWNRITGGLLNVGIWSIAINKDGIAFAGTNIDGIFKSTEPTTSLNDDIFELPPDYILHQNYPNPFNPTTTIKYIIPLNPPLLKGESEAGGFVTLKVFDVLGREVAVLVNQPKPPGTYEVEFNGTDLSSGVYFYTLIAGSYRATKKFLLIK